MYIYIHIDIYIYIYIYIYYATDDILICLFFNKCIP